MNLEISNFARLIVCIVLLGLVETVDAQQFKVTPHANGSDIPVSVEIELDETGSVELEDKKGDIVPGQILNKRLYWILPTAVEGKTQNWRVIKKTKHKKKINGFSTRVKEGEYIDVLYNNKPVSRLMTAFDTSSQEKQFETYKVYSHVFDEEGEEFITKGAKGSFCHHRGIYIGWMRTGFQGKNYDSWHMKRATQRYQSLHSSHAGNVLGQITPVIDWVTDEGKVFIRENRTLTFYSQPDEKITLIDFETNLHAPNGDVNLAGDPEHAGIQYRPHNDVSNAKSAKFLFHEEGIDPKKDRDLPWVSLNYPLRGKNYHVQHMSHTSAPKGSIYSAYRNYGRFGAYPKTQIKKGESLRLRYRFLITQGSFPSRESLHQNYLNFVNPPSVEILK